MCAVYFTYPEAVRSMEGELRLAPYAVQYNLDCKYMQKTQCLVYCFLLALALHGLNAHLAGRNEKILTIFFVALASEALLSCLML